MCVCSPYILPMPLVVSQTRQVSLPRPAYATDNVPQLAGAAMIKQFLPIGKFLLVHSSV